MCAQNFREKGRGGVGKAGGSRYFEYLFMLHAKHGFLFWEREGDTKGSPPARKKDAARIMRVTFEAVKKSHKF